MSVELRLLVWSAALALVQMVIAVGAAITQSGSCGSSAIAQIFRV